MSHARQQIRDAAISALTGLTTTGSRVFGSRLYALKDSDLPALLVNTDEESIEALTISSPAIQTRELSLLVRGVAQATASLDDTLDTIAAEVETVMGAAAPLGSIARVVGIDRITTDMAAELEKPVGVITLHFSVVYSTVANAPQTPL